MRAASIHRKTAETDIMLELLVDGQGATEISTGYGFADHMLTLLAFWAGFDLKIKCLGDHHVDAHHSLEDIGLCLGQALADACGDKKGIHRVGYGRVPLDEAASDALVDLSGRAYLVYEKGPLPVMLAGEESDLWREFFKSLAFKGAMNLHIRHLYGLNGHHLLESSVKALGMALRQALSPGRPGVLSTKGSLS